MKTSNSPTVRFALSTAKAPTPSTSAVPIAVSVLTTSEKTVCRMVTSTRARTAVSPCVLKRLYS